MITSEAYPYKVKLGDKIIGFPAEMSLKDVEIACRRLAASDSGEKRPKVVKSANKTASKEALGSNTPEEIVARLSERLGSTDPKSISEQEKDEIFQEIIGYRKVARPLLPDETRAVLDRKIAMFNNSQVKAKPAKKK